MNLEDFSDLYKRLKRFASINTNVNIILLKMKCVFYKSCLTLMVIAWLNQVKIQDRRFFFLILHKFQKHLSCEYHIIKEYETLYGVRYYCIFEGKNGDKKLKTA